MPSLSSVCILHGYLEFLTRAFHSFTSCIISDGFSASENPKRVRTPESGRLHGQSSAFMIFVTGVFITALTQTARVRSMPSRVSNFCVYAKHELMMRAPEQTLFVCARLSPAHCTRSRRRDPCSCSIPEDLFFASGFLV